MEIKDHPINEYKTLLIERMKAAIIVKKIINDLFVINLRFW